MNAKLLTVGGHKVLVTKPNVRQYGHLGLEILMSLALARAEQADVYFICPERVVSEALFELDTDEVRILQPGSLLSRRLKLMWAVHEARGGPERAWRAMKRAVEQQVHFALEPHVHRMYLPQELREQLKGLRYRLKAKVNEGRLETGRHKSSRLYYRRRLIRERARVFLRPEAAARARRLAVEHGIAADARIVTLHVREAGFKLGREMHERKLGARDDSSRNARIESYFDAIDDLVARGYTVVRIGDPTMTPVERKGVIDLATSPHRSQTLEVFCLLRSHFSICGEAGPAAVSYLTNTPCVTVNATDPISSYPIRSDGVYILKGVVERETGRRLTLTEMLGAEYMVNLRNTTRYRYVENSAAEIVEAVEEMLDGAANGWRDTAAQARFRELAGEAGQAFRAELTYLQKWGSDQGFLGDGRLGRAFTERYLAGAVVA